MIEYDRRARRGALYGAVAGALAAMAFLAPGAEAYTASGDRIFQMNLINPQIGPADELYARSSTLPLNGAASDGRTRQTNLSGVYGKTITERLGIRLENGYNWIDRDGTSEAKGWQNLEATLQYIAILDPADEFLFTVGFAREFGTGATRIGAEASGATTAAMYFGKGLGDIGVDYLRPLALKGNLGYQLADTHIRPDRIVAGLALEYSMPYFESKVRALGLPDLLQNLTPQIEFLLTAPTRSVSGQSTTALLAPGVTYAGEGWAFGISALVPLTDEAGRGAGVIAQLYFALDFLLPTSLGAPIFGR